ncbi:MAG: hypothetical protein AB7R87_11475 [Parvibaculaceae bacterium]
MSATLLLSSAATATDPGGRCVICDAADYYAWCSIFHSGGGAACRLQDGSLSPCDVDHLWTSGVTGIAGAIAAILVALLLLPRPLLRAPAAGILALVLGTAVAFHIDLIGPCGQGPDLETIRWSAWWRGEDPAIAEYCRPARPYTRLLDPRR